MEGPEWDAQTHSTVQLGSGAEDMAISGGVVEGGHLQVFQHLWAPPEDADILQIPGTGDIGGRQWLSGGGKELVTGKGGLEEDDVHPQPVGDGAVGVRIIFKGRDAGGASLWIRYLGCHPPHGQVPWGVSVPDGETAYSTAPAEDTVREVDIHLGSDFMGGGGVLDHGEIH